VVLVVLGAGGKVVEVYYYVEELLIFPFHSTLFDVL